MRGELSGALSGQGQTGELRRRIDTWCFAVHHHITLIRFTKRVRLMETKTDIDWKKVDAIIEKYNRDKESLLMIMQDISDIYNYVPPEVIPVLVKKLGVRESLIYSVATFYKTISLTPRGKYILSVCTGTACHVRGAEKIMDAIHSELHIAEGETSEDRLFTLLGVRCIGCCASGPVINVNHETHGGLDRSSVLKIIDAYKQQTS
jgi:NADH:ubiquinone oxidoreductase subunit E